MEPKPAGVMAAFPTTTQSHTASSIFSVVGGGGGDFSRIPSEWDLDELVNKMMIEPEVSQITNGSSVNDEDDVKPGDLNFRYQRDNNKVFADEDALFDSVYSDHLNVAFPVSTFLFYYLRVTLEAPFATSSSGFNC